MLTCFATKKRANLFLNRLTVRCRCQMSLGLIQNTPDSLVVQFCEVFLPYFPGATTRSTIYRLPSDHRSGCRIGIVYVCVLTVDVYVKKSKNAKVHVCVVDDAGDDEVVRFGVIIVKKVLAHAPEFKIQKVEGGKGV